MKEDFKLVLSILWSQVSSLFFLLLAISAGVSIFLGEKTDGIIILSIMLTNVLLGFFQEFKASKASQKLMQLVQVKVYTLREGILIQVPASDLVLGDVVHLVAGSVAPVDVQVIESQDAYIDDSMRTGESLPKKISMGENILSGAIVSSGKIIGHVIAVGDKSSIAKYRSQMELVKKWSSFTIFTNKIIKYVFIISLIGLLLSMIILVFILGKYSMAYFFVFAIAMLVGVVPEMLPLIITLILTNESLVLSKHKVIVKRLSSLQSLGAVQFLLIDKTGTITENKLKVLSVNDIDNFWEISNSISEGEYERSPMDSAYDEALNSSVGKIKTGIKKINNFTPFKNDTGLASFILEGGVKVARGQIKKVLELCVFDSRSLFFLDSIYKSADAYEKKGMRVIGLASDQAGEWKFTGFIAFHDPIKKDVESSLKTAHEMGIGVKILTGDSKEVALSVAEELGLIKHPDNVISLEQEKVSNLSDKQLLCAIVFAKCTPDDKLILIDRYSKLGPVAFLGDGINDALALKRADIGIAVDNASDIAKESADIILLEKDINPILKGVTKGRRALHNILIYIMYTLAGNAGTFFSLLIVSFFYPVLPMLPIQILLNNLLTDLPLMLIITDNLDKYSLKHIPHYEPNKILKRVLIFGLVSTVFDFIYFFIFKNMSVEVFQTGWFILSVLAELALVLSIRSSRSLFKSPALSIPLAVGIVVSAILPFIFVYNNFFSKVFKFGQLSLSQVSILFSIVITYIIANEVTKYFMRRKNLYNKPIVPALIFKN